MPLGIELLIALVIGGALGFLLGWISGSGGSQTDLPSLQNRLDILEKGNERTERSVKEEIARHREESANQARSLREELGATLKGTGDSIVNGLGELGKAQHGQLENFSQQISRLTETNEKKLSELRGSVETKLGQIQSDNAQKLEEMRRTVDEKLQGTLEKRLGESFKLVSDRLDQVHKGLGEMQTLAVGVGDLKKVLTNVKTRGIWGEIQLGNLLEQILTPEQFAQNVATKKNSAERVEFAIKFPGHDGEGNIVWLPVDAKFPKEDYERLLEASERGDAAGVEEAGKQLETRIKLDAKNIRDKYLDPPNTTDFGILFVPTEGIYAEILRRPGLFDILNREFRVVIAGPTNLAALLNSFQMGFRTLAIQKRSSEVWTLLGAVKTEFGRFGEVIEKVQKKIQEAGNAIDTAASKTRTIQRKLRDVQELPANESVNLIPLDLDEGDKSE